MTLSTTQHITNRIFWWRSNAAAKELRRLEESAILAIEDARAALKEAEHKAQKELKDGSP